MVRNVIQKETKSTFWFETHMPIAGETAFESDTDCRVENRRADKMMFEKKLSPQQQHVGRYIGHPCSKTKVLV